MTLKKLLLFGLSAVGLIYTMVLALNIYAVALTAADTEADLRMYAPVDDVVVVEWADLEAGTYSTCAWDGERYVIQLEAGLITTNPAVVRDALIHEWAHMLAWDDADTHDGLWGYHYAQAYSAVMEP